MLRVITISKNLFFILQKNSQGTSILFRISFCSAQDLSFVMEEVSLPNFGTVMPTEEILSTVPLPGEDDDI